MLVFLLCLSLSICAINYDITLPFLASIFFFFQALCDSLFVVIHMINLFSLTSMGSSVICCHGHFVVCYC